MAFYEELSRYYDIIFNREESTADFLKKGLSENNRVLDLACGTGAYSIDIAKAGHSVIGLDLDESMIKRAENKAEKEGGTVKFVAEDMRNFKPYLGTALQDMIFCIGNSLVHLNSRKDVAKLFVDIYDSLKEGGWMIVQIINYDRIINNNVTALPAIVRNNGEVKFVRNYSHTSDKSVISFDTELIVADEKGEQTYRNSVPLLALRSEEIVQLAASAGFSNYQLYGGFDSREFNEDSYALILKCYR